MSFPACDAFFRDPERTPARACVYMALQPPFLDFAEPKATKVDVVRHEARVSKRSVIKALAWLERRGYVVVHGRDSRGTPSMTLKYTLSKDRRLEDDNGAGA